jgi:iron complex transport system substrate-binding protein
MLHRGILLSAITLVFAASFWAQRQIAAPPSAKAMPLGRSRRIVSMAPSITETLYALGLGDRLVGVTRYCNYPPDVASKPRIGGYYDPNFEAIVSLAPDLVVMLEEHAQSLPGFEKLNMKTLVVYHKTIDGIIESFRTIGKACGKEAEGRRMADQYEERLCRIRVDTPPADRPRVLLALDRTFGHGHLADVYIAGVDDYFDKIIELAGGRNVYQQRGVRNPVVSPEGILWLNPDVIIDLVGQDVLRQYDRQTIMADWNELARVEAVKNHRVLVFDQDYACVPGPRFVQLVEDLARVLRSDCRVRETHH